MADNIQFQVDAVLGDTKDVEKKIKSLTSQFKNDFNITIDNKGALDKIDEVQKKADTLKKTIQSINLNLDEEPTKIKTKKLYGNIKSSDIAKRFGIKDYDSLDQRVQELANNMSKVIEKNFTVNAKTGVIDGAIIKYKDELGNVVTETLKWQTVSKQTVDGIETHTQKLVTTQLKYKDAIEQREKAEQRQHNALNRLGMETGTKVNTKSIKDIESLGQALSKSGVQWDKNKGYIKGFQQKLVDAGNTVTKFTVRQEELKNGKKYWMDTSYAISSVDGKLREVGRTQSDVINSQQSLSTMLTSAIERFAMWGTAMRLWTGIGNAVKDCTQYVKDLDKAMTDIQMVTMATNDEIRSLANTYNSIAQNLGRTTIDVAESATDWLRQGYSVTDTNMLIEDSMKLSTLGAMDSTDATTALTSAMKGYKLSADEVIGVVDKLVTVDMEAATSSADLATALARCANIARTSGVDIDQALGMIATTAEVTQQSAKYFGSYVALYINHINKILSDYAKIQRWTTLRKKIIL